LLTGSDQGRHEPAGPQELAPEARGDPTALLGHGQSEIERGSGRERRAVVYALAALPADVAEEAGDGVVGEREQRLTTLVRRSGEAPGDLRVARPPGERRQPGTRPL